ncbi:MAG: alanine dehydrogenase [Candidatus Omnitrophica bacterium]|nr:alanine dehydrogenase [Candidatus Omnitrophota bacterium]MCM8790335.1 alanine dehydrogenase [Candidatus Omnitrophota bacterium]
MQNKTLILTRRDIASVLSMRRVITIVERAFIAHCRHTVQMPPKIYIHLEKYCGDFRAMPAYIENPEACGIKWVNVHPLNTGRGTPAVMALIILSNPRTGFPLAVMDGTYITNYRTGASGGIAAKYLARKESETVGFIGCGTQAFYQLLALNEIFHLKAVFIYDSDARQVERFNRRCRELGIKAFKAKDAEGCVRDKDIIVTTTPSRKPIVKAAWVKKGAHINAIGADARGKEELEALLLHGAKVVVDDITQAIHSGEINVPVAQKTWNASRIHATLGQVITGARRGRNSPEDITIFDSTGLAIQDIAVAEYVYRAALRRGGIASKVDFRG